VKRGFDMGEYIADLSMVALLIISMTAVMGVVTNGIGIRLFSQKNKMEFVNKSEKFQSGWKKVGGKKKNDLS
jgi:hypothetical protein